MQDAISRHLSQSTGADLSGQHGMSSDIDATAIEVMAIESVVAALTGVASGANTSPAIKKTASNRQRRIERFTVSISHKPVSMESKVPSQKRQPA
jgi:hypothetical protein